MLFTSCSLVLAAVSSVASMVSAAPTSVTNDRRDVLGCLQFNDYDCRRFELYPVNSDQIDQHITLGTADNIAIPASVNTYMRGVFYMEGNPLSDEVLSLAGGKWVESEQAYYLNVYDQNIWSWDDSTSGRLLYDAVRTFALTYKLTFDSAGVGHVEPIFHLPPYLLELPLYISDAFANFTIVPTEDPNYFIRQSSFFGKPVANYQFIKIIDENGQKTDKWESVYMPRINGGAIVAPAGFSNATHLGSSQLLARVVAN